MTEWVLLSVVSSLLLVLFLLLFIPLFLCHRQDSDHVNCTSIGTHIYIYVHPYIVLHSDPHNG